MQALAPNLTTLVGELVGARLVQHAGSIMNLAKQPASTVQILGAEKALFRALKTKHDTPKYGLIYHASLIGQAAPKNKGKIARVLAAKCSLAVRVDALGDGDDATLGIEARAKVEARLRQLEGGALRAAAPNGTPKKLVDVVSGASAPGYSAASDVVLSDKKEKKKKKKKRKAEDDGDDDEAAAKKAKKSAKKAKKEAEEGSAKKKKKKDKK
jgi:nucleolar protein 58